VCVHHAQDIRYNDRHGHPQCNCLENQVNQLADIFLFHSDLQSNLLFCYQEYTAYRLRCHRSNSWFSPVLSDNVRLHNGKSAELNYNSNIINANPFPIPSSQKLDRDPRLFMGFLTLVVTVMYVLTLISYPDVRKTGTLILFTVLIIIHLVLHWLLEKIAARSRLVAWYVVVQGALAFIITLLSGNTTLLFAVYMGLIGEVVGLLGITRWGILAAIYFLLLSFVNLIQQLGLETAKWWLLGTLPIAFSITIYVRLYVRQMEARTLAQALLADLETANRQLSEYAARVEDLTIANERQRMARELHDTLSQGLAGLILQLEAADAYLEGNRPERARVILQQAMEKARGTLADARQAIDDLRQPVPHDLAAVAEQEAERFTISTGINCKPLIELKGEIPDQVADVAVRAISEGLTNIARHARARNVALRLTGVGKSLEVEIGDDGVGFDPEAVQAGHYGLLGLRERVRLAGGSVDICSEPGKGTRIVIRFLQENPFHG
jgi:two-component system, NarL family, sensor histidine kinase YdfH